MGCGVMEFDTHAQRFEQAKSRLQATVGVIRNGATRCTTWCNTPSRLVAREAEFYAGHRAGKGIFRAQQRCGPDEAFDLLRRASQRANVKVRVLTEQVVAHVADKSESYGEPGSLAEAEQPERQDIPA